MNFKLEKLSLVKLFCFLFILTSVNSVFAKSKKNDAYIKYVHPRTYSFDLCDADSQVMLTYNKWSKRFETEIDFSKYVKGDLPINGDKIVFYYNGYANKATGNIYAELIIDGHEVSGNLRQDLTDNKEKKEWFKGKVSFLLFEQVGKTLKLRLYSDKKNVPGQLDQVYLNFKRIVESTDTVKELAQEQKAIKQNVEIVEVTGGIEEPEEIAEISNAAEISNDAELEEIKRKAEEAAAIAAALEAKRIADEKAKLEALRLEQEKERLKQQEEIEKAMAEIKNNVARHEKEYLNDYMVFDEPEAEEDTSVKYEVIENPDEADEFGRTLLMKAAKAGNDWQIKNLLNSGAKVNLKDKDGWTALMYAVRYQETMTCVDLLINAGATIKTENKYGSSALMIAASYNNNPEIMKKLLAHYSVSDKAVLKSLVLLLSENHTTEYIQLSKLNIFINQSVPLNTFYEGKTPLMYAAEYGNSTKVIQALLDNNAITSIRSSDGKTAYEYAADNKNLKHDSTYWSLNKK